MNSMLFMVVLQLSIFFVSSFKHYAFNLSCLCMHFIRLKICTVRSTNCLLGCSMFLLKVLSTFLSTYLPTIVTIERVFAQNKMIHYHLMLPYLAGLLNLPLAVKELFSICPTVTSRLYLHEIYKYNKSYFSIG